MFCYVAQEKLLVLEPARLWIRRAGHYVTTANDFAQVAQFQKFKPSDKHTLARASLRLHHVAGQKNYRIRHEASVI
jgi:hypothetical protein